MIAINTLFSLMRSAHVYPPPDRLLRFARKDTFQDFLFDPIYRTVIVSKMIPLRPNINNPMLAARGSPSRTEPTAQAMLKRMEKIPMIRPAHDIQSRDCFFEKP